MQLKKRSNILNPFDLKANQWVVEARSGFFILLKSQATKTNHLR